VYADFIFTRLGEATRRALETLMERNTYNYQSEFARKYFEQGHAQGRRAVLRRLLVQRFGDLSTQVEDRLARASMDELERWLDRVIPARSVDEVLAQTPLPASEHEPE
ncbi:MAG: hypothetical protein AAGC55_31235, partial [Myxococcota bacterium]